MATAASRIDAIRRASAQLARAPFQDVPADQLMTSICDAMHSDSMAFLSVDIGAEGQARAIPHHAHHQVRDATHDTYVAQFFRNDPILSGAIARLRAHGWAVFRLGDPCARVHSSAHEQYLEEFLYPAGIRHVMALVSVDPAVANRVNIVGCHRTSSAAGFTFNDLENAQLLAPATVACFSQRWRAPDGTGQSAADVRPRSQSRPPIAMADTVLRDSDLSAAGLTARERDIVDRVVAGARNRDIASFLGISVKTVENHLSNIYSKTMTPSRQALILHVLHSQNAH